MPDTKKFLDATGTSYLWTKIKAQLDLKASASDVTTLSGQVSTLIGSDSSKSVRTIANEELAAQLIASDADEALDSLQEIAAWIQSHPENAATMNSAISSLQTLVGNTAVSTQISNAITALNLATTYATAAQGAKADTALQPADVIALTNAEIDTAIANSSSSGGSSGS